MILALNCKRNGCLERLKPDAPDPALLSEMFFVAEPLSVSLASSPALPNCLGDHGCPERHCHAIILV